MSNIVDTRSLIENDLNEEKWRDARKLIRIEMKKHPDNHWLVLQLSTTYYEEHQYDRSLELIKMARQMAPKCPAVAWNYASSLDMVGDKKEAIKIWQSLLKRGVDKLAFLDDCGEGILWTKSLLNDCLYRIGLSYADMGKSSHAIRYIEEHISQRRPGIPSLYSMKEVKRKLKRLREMNTIKDTAAINQDK